MTDLVFTTSASVGDDNTIDLSTGVPDVASETADGDGLSLVEAVLIVSPFGGTNTIQASEMLPSVFLANVTLPIGASTPLDLTLSAADNGNLNVLSDFQDILTLESDDKTFTTVNVDLTLQTFVFGRSDGVAVTASGDNVTFNNGGDVFVSGFSMMTLKSPMMVLLLSTTWRGGLLKDHGQRSLPLRRLP